MPDDRERGHWPQTTAAPPPIVPDGYGEPGIPPIIRELFKLLPPTGTEWPAERRVAFLNAAANLFNLVYGDVEGRISIDQIFVRPLSF